MQMSAILSLHGGGPGSGCRGPSCGRKPTGAAKQTEDFYHGTVLPSAKAILQQGLKPNPSAAFHVGHIPVRDGYIYASSSEKEAKSFARLRAAYETMQPGSSRWIELPEHQGYGYELRKASDAPPPSPDTPSAAVVEIELPKTMSSRFRQDPDSLRSDDLASTGVIPSNYIKSVEVLSDNKWKKYSPQEADKLAAQSASSTYLVYFGPIDALKTHLKAGKNAA